MSAHMLYHMLDYNIGTHKIAIYFFKLNAVRFKHLLYPYTVLVGFNFILQPAYRIVFLNTLKEIIKVVVTL